MSKAVRKVALVAAGAALGFVTGGIGFALIGGAVGLFVGSQQDAALKTGSGGSGEPSAQTVRSSKAPARFILGRVSTGGVLVWAQEQAGSQTDGEWVHLVYVLSEGAIDALETIYLGEEEIVTYNEYASYELVVDPVQVNAFLKANCRDWKDGQIGRGLSFVRLSLKHNAEKFPSGIPDVRFVVRGRNDLYDPRTGMSGYSDNTALHLLWYLRARCKVPDDEIVFETFASAANVCDESVANADGSAGIRYRTGCVIGADEQRTQVIQKLEESCAGQLIRVGGKWMLQAGAYYGPHDFEITEDMVIGTVSGSTEVNNDAALNIVTGTFIDPSQTWAETDFPEVRIQQWVDEDGGEASESMSLGYVTDAYQAQRLANIRLRRARAGGSLQLPMNFAGYNCRPGRVVRVNLPSLNIIGEFIVTDWNMAADDGCTVTVSQYEAAIFDDAVGQPYNPIGFINLPAGGLGSPTNLAWTADGTAEVTQGVLSWAQPFGVVTAYAVTVRQAGVAVQAQQVPATTLQLPLSGLPSGSYTMSVAALGPLTRSGEASITVSINGPPIPESCVVQATIDTITLIPGNTLHGLNGGTYEYFFSTNPQATQGDYLGQGLTLTHTGLAFATNYAYFVRSKNAYGVSAFLKVVASTSTDVENMLGALKDKIESGQLYPALREDIALISGPPTMPGSVNERLKEVNDQLQDQIDAIGDVVDALEYDPSKTYTTGDNTRQGQRLYVAIKNVPAAAGGGNAPPNPTYWLDIGQVARTENGSAARLTLVETKVTEQDGKLTAQAQRIDGVQTSLSGKADASTVNSIGNRVTQNEQSLISQGQAITGVENKIGNIGGDNLLPNSSFEEVGSPGRAKHWLASGGTGSLVDSSLAQSKKAQRVYRTAAALNDLAEVTYTPADGLPYIKVREGTSLVLSAYARGTNGKGFAQYLQFINAAGGVISTAVNHGIAITDTFKRYTLIATAPAGTVSVRPYVGRVVNNSATVSDIWIEVDNVQLQEGAVATAYTASTEQSIAVQAAATQAVAARVEQTEQGLNSQAAAITQLTGTVAGKADASALNALTNTVNQQGGTLTSQGNSITELKNGIGNLGAAGMDAAPSGQWQFDTGVEGWGATNATLTATAGSITVTATAGDPNIFSPFISLNGSLFSRVKAKITRRAGLVTDWDGTLYYSTTGHPVSGNFFARIANPNLAVGESAVLEWDMASLQAGSNDWITSTITRIRIDLGTVPGGAFDIDWIVVGRLGPSASSTVVEQMSSTVSQHGTQLTAQASRLDGLYVQVNPEMEGDSSGMAGAAGGLVGVWTEQSARVEDGIATGKKIETVQAQIGETSASVQQLSEVVVDVSGKVSAQTTLKVETNQNGRKVVAGLAIGSNGEEGEILLMAQRLAIIDGLDGQMILPFVVQNGQVFINQAVINQAFIKEIVAGMTIRSAALNSQGLPLLEINFAAGTFVLRGQDANGSTLLNNGGLYVYDANGIERTAVGRLT